jgi:hypothetical protein
MKEKKKHQLTLKFTESEYELILNLAAMKKISRNEAVSLILKEWSKLKDNEFVDKVDARLIEMEQTIQSEFYKVRSMVNKAREYAEASWLMGGYIMSEMRDVERAKTYRDTALKRAKKGE